MTEKLYYLDAYTKEFEAVILSVEESGDGFLVVLNKTAFFPEEGGQYSDKGYIGDARVWNVYEENGTVYHVCDKIPGENRVLCKIDFDERYEKMQIHTAEHIISGVFHNVFGYENVGFHLGADVVTMDINAVLTEKDIVFAEEAANRVVYENVPVTTHFPTPDELSQLKYRAKLDLTENVRLVKIGEHDLCACCAPHVKSSGEVGLIRLLDFTKHRGGTRITITAGIRAARDSRYRYETVREISALLSVPKNDVADGVRRLISDYEEAKSQIKRARSDYYLLLAKNIAPTDKNLVLHYPEADAEDAKTIANELIMRVGGILVILFGKEGEFKYLMVSKSRDLRALSKDINSALGGRGGGKPEAIQGTLTAALDEVREYFK